MAINFQNAQLLKEALSILDGNQEKGALTVYNGDPNGNVTGTVGALCIDYSGSGKLWKNSNGSTTWVEVGSGSGGSAYPDNVIIVNSPRTLTLADQGLLVCLGHKVTLPSSAPNGTTYKLVGSPGDVIIDSNGSLISGIGNGTNLIPGDSYLTLVAVNTPNLIWVVQDRSSLPNYVSGRIYMQGNIIKDSASGRLYVSLGDFNNNALSSLSSWRSIDGRYTNGSIALSEMVFVGTTSPSSGSGVFRIFQLNRDVVLLDIELDFTSPGVGITETGIGSTASYYIESQVSSVLDSSTENIFGIGYVRDNSGFGSAIQATCMYSPVNLGFIKAKHSVINVSYAHMQFFIKRNIP